MKIHDRIVYGERVSALMPGLIAFGDAAFIDAEGMYRSSVILDPVVGEPLARALMRAESELLLEDAERIGTEATDGRTPDQRRADAFVRVVVATGKSRASSRA